MAVEKSVQGESTKQNKGLGCLIWGAIGCFGSIVVLFLIGLILYLVLSRINLAPTDESTVKEGSSDSRIASVRISGLITEAGDEYGYSFGGGVSSSEQVIQQIDRALDDDSVKAIIIRMNTPGGETVASDLIYQKVVSANTQKPVVTWMSGMGASGGYYVAVGSDHIVTHHDTITGSVGTILQISNIEGLYEKLGIETRTFKSGKFKDDEGLFGDELDDEASSIMQNLVDDSYENFYNIVKSERELTDEQMKKFADGRVISGSEAFDLGLVDEVGTFDNAIDYIEDKLGIRDMSVVEYRSGGFWDTLYWYRSSLLRKFGILGNDIGVGAKLYYVLDF